MNIKLNEWNKVLQYANEVCDNLKDSGLNVKIKPYTMYNGDRGVYLQLFDMNNNFFSQYPSGIYNGIKGMKWAIDKATLALMNDNGL